MKQESRLRNEDGAVLVVALMMLVLLTILGISISSTSEVELQIAGNEMRYKENLYGAEAAAIECAQFMEQTADSVGIDPSISDDFIIPYAGEDGDEIYAAAVRNDDFWDEVVDTDNISPEPGALGNTRYIAYYAGVPHGENLEGTLREFAIYGRYFDPTRPDLGRSIVRIGYRRDGGIIE